MTSPAPAPPPSAVQIASMALTGAATITANVSQATANIIIALWQRVNPYDHKQVNDFKIKAGQIIVASQRTVANAHTASQLMQLRAIGINQNPVVTIPDNVRGQSVTFGPKKVQVHAATDATVTYQESIKPTADEPSPEPKTVERTVTKSDAAPDQIFERAAVEYRYAKSIGADGIQAGAAAEARIGRIVDNNLILAQRLAEQQTLSAVKNLDKRVHGYRRVIHPELSIGGVCGLCVAASSRRYYLSELKPIHDRCRCSIAPITDQHDIGDLLNRQDLDQLYDDAGKSTNGAALKHLRYELQHHHELGPVLIRVKGDSVPHFTPKPPKISPKLVNQENIPHNRNPEKGRTVPTFVGGDGRRTAAQKAAANKDLADLLASIKDA